ncbi:TIGR02466 family protein [Asticcacaulis sp. BYS171W]|uniref:TIGR02466 family protein n=1 Tax=Asticcacaulis aquaticus TaxID=2984212 RepID=A0ABT5HPK3_9CAUL|nr:TIGR02466 family protein [Asticcacaulis aquaticus]MDC7682003.1 TIGR02466 family protein [Asticcacaulis aquaticus]
MQPNIPAAGSLTPLFVTEVYRTDLAGTSADPLITRLEAACRRIAAEDKKGWEWSAAQGYLGYTSYESIVDPTKIDPDFAELKALLDVQALIFARLMEFDLRGKVPTLGALWINILDPNGSHGGHTHPHSVFSGTIYISVPEGASALQFEDPRLGFMMHAPQRLPNARPYRQVMVPMAPARGTLLLWESWLRHEVPTNRAKTPRISISFNYDVDLRTS